ncbi:MAG TPA: Ig-like domain-containing protein [Candidatus Acidoferrum sp.]|jgi:hypothetical protein|nr:Ig-like domain-containing protein [Candidatus Acidoferrum sp.]
MPVVTIAATDPSASWAGDTGTFTLFRTGDPTQTLNVYCRILGTATNGVDYQAISSFVQIPGGSYSNSVVITPINHGQLITKTVTLLLAASPMAPPVNYIIGYPSNATVFIKPASVTNLPPLVKISTPANGSIFYTPANIPICANAYDIDGFVATVEFFAGTNSLGVRTNNPMAANPLNPFCLVWSNAPAGAYALTAVATDDGGASTTSEAVNITVVPGPPPTNLPPVVSLVAPTNGSTFLTPVNIPLIAVGSDPDGFVTSVEFFAGSTSLGVVSNWVVVDPLPGGGTPAGSRGFFLLWSNVPAGSYVLTAKATDDGGASTTSDPVNITVNTGPPPTNFPPVVRITSPPNGAVFHAPVNIPIYAYASDRDGFVATVEFFAGTNSLGLGHGLTILPWAGTNTWPTFRWPTNVFTLTWSNAPLGQYALTAVATDDGGASTVSPPVNISIEPSPPPPTNRPPIVSIVATDPVAIEGTNCWPWLGMTNPVPTWSNWVSAVPPWRFFTNCGPKNATFTVRRFGVTNDDLTVSYDIGGSGTNGVDYVPLSGVVTIPAGERKAAITLIPLDDGPPDINSTVVVKLTPGTNYFVGFPGRAAAIILDSRWPRPVTGMMPGNCFQLSSDGPDGAWFHVEFSTDMLNWTSICTNQVVNGSIDFVDPDAQNDQARFYRAVPESAPPPE